MSQTTELHKPFPISSHLQQSSMRDALVSWEPAGFVMGCPLCVVMATAWSDTSKEASETPCDDSEKLLDGMVSLTTTPAEFGLLDDEERVAAVPQPISPGRHKVA